MSNDNDLGTISLPFGKEVRIFDNDGTLTFHLMTTNEILLDTATFTAGMARNMTSSLDRLELENIATFEHLLATILN